MTAQREPIGSAETGALENLGIIPTIFQNITAFDTISYHNKVLKVYQRLQTCGAVTGLKVAGGLRYMLRKVAPFFIRFFRLSIYT